MALDFSILNAQPSFAQRFMQGQEQAQQNRLREMQMQQAQQDRAFQLEQRRLQAERDAKFDQIAGMISQHGMDPDDPKVLSQFAQAALQARNPAMVEFAGQMAERAAKRRAAKEEAARIGGILSPTLPPGPPLRQPVEPGVNALAAPPTNALAAPQQDLLAGTPFAIGPMAAPAASARPPAPAVQDNAAKIAEYERQIDALEAMGTPAALAQAKRLERTVERLRPKQEATPADIVAMRRLGFPETPEGYRAYRDAQRAERLLTPEEESQRVRIALASRPPAQPREPAAPTITQIQDPTDPTRMITIDARRYEGGGMGAPGVIGASGKTPKAEADKLKQEQGASQAMDILDTLKTAYGELDRMRAIPSEQRGGLSNVAAGAAATGVGQAAGRLFGTKEQTQRDIIASSRNQLLMALKNATGMSSQQLNSNVELRSWLDALSDPSRSIQANQAILDNVERFIVSGGKYSAKTSGGKVTPAPSSVRSQADAIIRGGR